MTLTAADAVIGLYPVTADSAINFHHISIIPMRTIITERGHARAASEVSTLVTTRLVTAPELTSVLTWHVRPSDDLHVAASVDDWMKNSFPKLLLTRSGVVTVFFNHAI